MDLPPTGGLFRPACHATALVLALFVCGAAFAAQPAAGASGLARASPDPAGEDEVLDEVVVSGVRPSREATHIASWLRRLLGQFTVEGYVDLGGKGSPQDRLPVRGLVDCEGFGYMPAVSCHLNIDWPAVKAQSGEEIPGGVSTLAPAMIAYAFEVDRIALRYMMVDSTGTSEAGMDYLRGNTFSATSGCIGIPGDCKRVMRVNARSDGNLVQMQIDIIRDSRLALRYLFVMNRTQRAPGKEMVGATPR